MYSPPTDHLLLPVDRYRSHQNLNILKNISCSRQEQNVKVSLALACLFEANFAFQSIDFPFFLTLLFCCVGCVGCWQSGTLIGHLLSAFD